MRKRKAGTAGEGGKGKRRRVVVEEEEEEEEEEEACVVPGSHAVEDMRSDGEEGFSGSEGDEGSSGVGGDDDDDDDEEPATTLPGLSKSNSNATRDPKIVVFTDTSTTHTRSTGSKGDWKAFMSSSIKRLSSVPKPASKLTPTEAAQEVQDVQNDRSLAELLRASKLIDDYTAATLTGRDRRRHLEQRTIALGGHKAKVNVPQQIKTGMDAAERARAAKRLQTAKELGLYHASLKTQIMGATGEKEREARTERIRERVKHRSRGVEGGFGSFRNGVLKVSKAEIESVEKTARRVAKIGKPRRKAGGKEKKPKKFRR
ncbi:uncharacterized protein EV422DRAFT_10414 [Fimicolochytrium jonesii]|uniref:uncharacterized protein n=1 Tax=Fimicolochytrium jonesii TaxID=1396493 RepID=UPI0022FDF8EA|nr:uncharacterized protein EV422DRAFT_10414 [Fimicolochytrium jonesii]KAI8826773.1 hypothetical protein EV422DRAFT_10414 [Fimicolochytrium jonesii]